MNILKRITEFLLPKQCFSCGVAGRYLCDNCIRNKVFINYKTFCPVCGSEVFNGLVHETCKDETYLDGLFFVTVYDASIKKMLRRVKYHFEYEIGRDLGILMGKYLKMKKLSDCILTSVPLHIDKKKFRGFNQSEVLALPISKISGLKYEELLKRCRFTNAQAKLNEESRFTNLKEAFEFIGSFDSLPKKVIIVDDVFTTGSTLNECAKVLKEAGIIEVYGFTLAKSRVRG